jgi:hypothetical protein
VFDLTLTSAELADLAPLRDVLRDDDAEPSSLNSLLTQRAREVTDEDVQVKVRQSGSEHLVDFGLVIVGFFDHGDERSLGGDMQWLASLYSSLWHEVAHVLYSYDFPWLDDARLRYAANLLEDGRAERRLVDEHPELKTWLRRNVLLGRDSSELATRAANEGWPHEFIVVGSRDTAGVLQPADYDTFCEQLPDTVPTTELVAAWSPYLTLGDGDLDEEVVGEAASALVPHLRAHHVVGEP